MAEFTTRRIDFAAVFTGPHASVTVLKIDDSSNSLIRIEFTSLVQRGSPLWYWAYGGWKDGTSVDPVWANASDPWVACNYWGPMQTSSATAVKFCGQCGNPRANGAKFCGSCGEMFPQSLEGVADIRTAILDTRRDSDEAMEFLRDLITTYSLREFDQGDQEAFRAVTPHLFAGLTLDRFIDGRAGEPNAHELTLARAQTIGARVAGGERLSDTELTGAAALLTKAPLVFGYWGPFKNLLKHFDPHHLPMEFGGALGRLSKTPVLGGGNVSAPGCEDLAPIASLFQLPATGTLIYMRRRMRRQLVALGRAHPQTYVKVAAAVLGEHDAPLNGGSYIPAYILLGRDRYLTDDSRLVRFPVDQSTPVYPHPEAWEANADLAVELLHNVRRSPEILTFAVQVLRSAGRELPPLTASTIPLAVESSDPLVAELGFASLASTPECWKAISSRAWIGVFTQARNEHLQEIVLALLSNKRVEPIARATWEILDRAIDVEAVRLASVAQIYLAYSAPGKNGYRPWPRSTTADLNAIAVLAHTHGFDRTPDAWRAILAYLDPGTVLAALIQLFQQELDITAGTIAILQEAIVVPKPDHTLEEWSRMCFSLRSGQADALGWRILNLASDVPAVRDRLWNWLKTGAMPQDRRFELVSQTLASVDPVLANEWILQLLHEWDFTSDQLAELLAESRDGAALLWRSLEESTLVRDLVLEQPTLLQAVGEHVTADHLRTLSAAQGEVLVAYLAHDPQRLERDLALCVQLATTPAPDLQRTAIASLERTGALPTVWLALAESALPLALSASHRYLESLSERDVLTDAVLAAIDSQVVSVRDMGLALLDERRDQVESSRIWTALLESDDPKVQGRVAEEALIRDWADSDDLGTFDRRVLVTRRVNRRAKEQVKERLVDTSIIDPRSLIQPQRVEALLDLASAANTRDREWALQRLALLSLVGVTVDGISVNTTTEGGL